MTASLLFTGCTMAILSVSSSVLNVTGVTESVAVSMQTLSMPDSSLCFSQRMAKRWGSKSQHSSVVKKIDFSIHIDAEIAESVPVLISSSIDTQIPVVLSHSALYSELASSHSLVSFAPGWIALVLQDIIFVGGLRIFRIIPAGFTNTWSWPPCEYRIRFFFPSLLRLNVQIHTK